MPPHITSLLLADTVQGLGWEPGNDGENRIIRILHEFGLVPQDIERQFRLGKYRLDFAFPAERFALESDGWVHTAAKVRRIDRDRDRQLRDWGWETVRLDIDGPIETMQDQIRQVLATIAFVRSRSLTSYMQRLLARQPDAKFCCYEKHSSGCRFHAENRWRIHEPPVK
jgi:very-short-patch-repair endonuclease